MKISLASISFNHVQLPTRAVIRTGRRRVKVEWRDVCGDWWWFIVSGYDDAAKARIPSAIAQIEWACAEGAFG